MKSKGYMAIYMLARYHSRMNEARKFLGGKCTKCGSKKNLQIDHIDRTKKGCDNDRAAFRSRSKFLEEMKKCQLLCRPCHTIKTVTVDLGRKMARGTHGTLSSYRYCKCRKCKDAASKYSYMLKKKKRAESISAAL